MKKNKKLNIPENTVLVASNIDGIIDIQSYKVEELIDNGSIALPVSDERFDSLPEAKKINSIPDSVPIDPFIPYAKSMDPNRDGESVFIGFTETKSGKRIVTETEWSTGDSYPMRYPAIVGDEVGPLGVFVPFNATLDGMRLASTLFTGVVDHIENGVIAKGAIPIGRNGYMKLPCLCDPCDCDD